MEKNRSREGVHLISTQKAHCSKRRMSAFAWRKTLCFVAMLKLKNFAFIFWRIVDRTGAVITSVCQTVKRHSGPSRRLQVFQNIERSYEE